MFSSLGLVYWELGMRTNLPGVETSEYLMPYHDQVSFSWKSQTT